MSVTILDILFADCVLPDGELDTDQMVSVLADQPRLREERREWVKVLAVWLQPHIGPVYSGETLEGVARTVAVETVECALYRQEARAEGF